MIACSLVHIAYARSTNIDLSAAGSPTTGPVMMTTASDVALHGRHLNEVSASTVGEFTAAVGNSAVDKILLAAGTYYLTSDMCSGSAH